MNSYNLSKNALQQISEVVSDFTARETAALSRECITLALRHIASSNFDQAHFYLALAKEFMLIALNQKRGLIKHNELASSTGN